MHMRAIEYTPLETLFEIADLLEIEAEKLLTKKNEK